MKTIVAFIAFFCSTFLAYSEPLSSDLEVKAEVLKNLIQAAPTEDNSYGLDLPQKELLLLTACLGNKVKLLPINLYVQKYKKSGRNLVQTCFWMRVSTLTNVKAKVVGGNYPLTVVTKYGPMAAYTTDFIFVLRKDKGRWTIVSKDISGES